MEGGSHSSPCPMLGFGDNSNNTNVVGDDHGLLCPMIISVPPYHPHNFFTTSTQYLPLPPPPSSNGASSFSAAQTSGGFFMETDHHPSSSSCPSFSVVKARIMAHPLYHRLLAAYVNCQKVPATPSSPLFSPAA